MSLDMTSNRAAMTHSRDRIAQECDTEIDEPILKEEFPKARPNRLSCERRYSEAQHDEVDAHCCFVYSITTLSTRTWRHLLVKKLILRKT